LVDQRIIYAEIKITPGRFYLKNIFFTQLDTIVNPCGNQRVPPTIFVFFKSLYALIADFW